METRPKFVQVAIPHWVASLLENTKLLVGHQCMQRGESSIPDQVNFLSIPCKRRTSSECSPAAKTASSAETSFCQTCLVSRVLSTGPSSSATGSGKQSRVVDLFRKDCLLVSEGCLEVRVLGPKRVFQPRAENLSREGTLEVAAVRGNTFRFTTECALMNYSCDRVS